MSLFGIVMDDESPDVIQLADWKPHYKSNKTLGVLGLKPLKDVGAPQPDIEVDRGVLVPRYTEFCGWSNRILLAGMSLSGKSTFASMIAQSYKRQHKKNDVFVISTLEADPALDKVKPTRIEFDEECVENPIQLDELEDSLVIFDDYQGSGDKEIEKAIENLRDRVMSSGRHKKIAVISSAQLLRQGKKSINPITNALQVVLFPLVSKHQCHGFCHDYLYLPKPQIEKICNVKSRWVLLNRTNPPYCLHEKGLFML